MADTETASSLLWFAAVQGIESKQDSAGLAPQGCFISAEAIERVVGQIDETQTRGGYIAYFGRRLSLEIYIYNDITSVLWHSSR